MKTWIHEGKTGIEIRFTKQNIYIIVSNEDESENPRKIKVYVGDDFNGGSEAEVLFENKLNKEEKYYEWKPREVSL